MQVQLWLCQNVQFTRWNSLSQPLHDLPVEQDLDQHPHAGPLCVGGLSQASTNTRICTSCYHRLGHGANTIREHNLVCLPEGNEVRYAREIIIVTKICFPGLRKIQKWSQFQSLAKLMDFLKFPPQTAGMLVCLGHHVRNHQQSRMKGP